MAVYICHFLLSILPPPPPPPLVHPSFSPLTLPLLVIRQCQFQAWRKEEVFKHQLTMQLLSYSQPPPPPTNPLLLPPSAVEDKRKIPNMETPIPNHETLPSHQMHPVSKLRSVGHAALDNI